MKIADGNMVNQLPDVPTNSFERTKISRAGTLEDENSDFSLRRLTPAFPFSEGREVVILPWKYPWSFCGPLNERKEKLYRQCI